MMKNEEEYEEVNRKRTKDWALNKWRERSIC